MSTSKTSLGLTEPIKFLGSTVISFNSQAGFGSSAESSLTVELVNDCNNEDAFLPIEQPDTYGVGMPVRFPDNTSQIPDFQFAGILSSWEAKKGSGGLTYSVVVRDPRQLLENSVVVVDSLLTGPIYHINYYNVYALWEQDLLASPNCLDYGTSYNNDKGMPYWFIIYSLAIMNPYVYPATHSNFGGAFKVNWADIPGISFPGDALHPISFVSNTTSRLLPNWYRMPGPGASILQIIDDICNALAYDYYSYLEWDGTDWVIRFGLIDMNYAPTSFSNIINSFENISTDISYGQEFRNEKNKMVLLGENIHYLVPCNQFDFFFGEDIDIYNNSYPVVPYGYDDCGFWISKNIQNLNMSLSDPFPTNGPFTISELDIRSAMSSFEGWQTRALDYNTPGTLNLVIRQKFANGVSNMQNIQTTITNIATSIDQTKAVAENTADAFSMPSPWNAYRQRPDVVEELKKIHGWLSNLGSTYYGKQWMCRLSTQKVCKKYDPETNEIVYTDTPTNAGAWVEADTVLGLSEPALSLFRSEDRRLTGFAQFTLEQDLTAVNTLYEYNTNPSNVPNFSKESSSESAPSAPAPPS